MMRHFTILSLLALCGSALSAPKSENGLNIRSSNECKSVTVLISILSQHNVSATSFCSSFISIPVKTVTSTKVSFSLLWDGILELLIVAGRKLDVQFYNNDTDGDNKSNNVC